MLRIGLTGGIGAGKSTVARRLVDVGAVLVDADLLAREVVAPGSAGLAEVVARFGDGVLTQGGDLDRAALGRRVFTDPTARGELNRILHPRIAALAVERMAAAGSEAVVVHDVPLLVENGLAANYHLVVVVEADPELRIRRLVEHRGLDVGEARARVAAQADDATRRAAADVVLVNTGPVDELVAAVDRLWAERMLPYEANLRAGRVARRPEAVPVVPADPGWPQQARRLVARVERLLGTAALQVAHVGPTAVPGRAAQDLIELEVTVPAALIRTDGTGAPSEADPERVVGPLTRGGFPLLAAGGLRHGAADPGRATELVIVPREGTPGSG